MPRARKVRLKTGMAWLGLLAASAGMIGFGGPRGQGTGLGPRDARAQDTPAAAQVRPPRLLPPTEIEVAPGAEAEAPVSASTETTADADVELDSLDEVGVAQFIRKLALTHLPARYVDEKQWGQKKKVWDGVKVSLDGLRVDSEQRFKEVNQGTWKRYEIKLANVPDALQLSIDQVREAEGGRLRFDVLAVARLKATGRLAQWERGVQLVSLGAEADAAVRLTATCEIGIDMDTAKLPPDVLLKPQVVAANVQLLDFRLRRVGDLDGPLVKQLGRNLRDVLEDRLAKENQRLPDRINRQIAKKQDKLRLSLHDWLAKKLSD